MNFCSIHQIRGQVGEGNGARSGREFQRHNHAFGKEDTAKELQNHAAKTQDTWEGAVENAEDTEILRAVCFALNQLRAATTKQFDIKEIIWLEHTDHEQVAEKRQAASQAKTRKIRVAMTAAELTEKSGMRKLRNSQ